MGRPAKSIQSSKATPPKKAVKPSTATSAKRRKPVAGSSSGRDGDSTKVTTIRIPPSIQAGIGLLESAVGVKHPLNKWITIALADYIERRTAAAEDELERALSNIRAYRKSDPGYRNAIEEFIEAEVAFAGDDPVEGSTERSHAGPAVSMIRELIRG